MNTGWGLVILGVLYIINTLVERTFSYLAQIRLQNIRLESEERQAQKMAAAGSGPYEIKFGSIRGADPTEVEP